jgi:acetylornithine deacetylase
MQELHAQAIELLKELIRIPSYSTQEGPVADHLQQFLESKKLIVYRKGNNVWIKSPEFVLGKPVVLLNSHIDTVKPSASYTNNPFDPIERDGKLYGLGSNDAGASLVSMLFAFIYITKSKLPYNLIFAATAEEENSGKGGIESILDQLGKIDLGIVGEPTKMQMAIAEKGLMVLDCNAFGKAGHAAREEGENAIYNALKDIEWFKTYKFPDESALLGKVKMTVTQINGGYQHNIIPDKCTFVVDVRTNEHYSNRDAYEVIKANTVSEILPRSFRLNSSTIPLDHPLVKKGIAMGLNYFGSPTTSDQAVMNFITAKIGPGDSARSHTADEFVFLDEIKHGINVYIKLLSDLQL